MLVIENLSVVRNGRNILDSVSLTAKEGQVLLIAGHNGAGKSTLLKTIFGELSPSRGAVRGAETGSTFYLPQGRTVFPSLKVSEHLRLYRSLVPESERPEALLAAAVLPDQALAGELSGGQRQWLAASRLNAGRPRLILIDELTTGLSPAWRKRMLESLRDTTDAAGAPTLLVEHNVRDAIEIADRLLVLRQGKLVLDTAAAPLRQDTAKLEEVLVL
ncbi:MAG TPA: ATP-binding cassette domain-containing protein [Allosphingosinicella sp.]|nr:ATP-binding cassette domain-containing protein [Allosphingosinicella sp.]